MNEIRNRLLSNLESIKWDLNCDRIDPEHVFLKSEYLFDDKNYYFLFVEILVYKKEKELLFEYDYIEILYFEVFRNNGLTSSIKYKKEELKTKILYGLFL